MAILSGTVIGQYRIDRKLGAGGMGEVYAATHLMLGREVALKTLPAAEIRTDAAAARLVREARAAAALATTRRTARSRNRTTTFWTASITT